MPDLIDVASSGRARCRACSEKIAKGELRFGEAAPNPYGEGETFHWFHLACAADRRAEKLGATLRADEREIPDRERYLAIVDTTIQNPKLERAAKAERAPSGRAHCRHCKDLIENGSLRVKIEVFEEGMMNPLGFVHARCSSYRFGQVGLVDRLRRWSPTLTDEDFAEFERELEEGAKADPASPAADGAT